MIYILPTDTCYGIWCPVDEVKSYEKIYKIKKRSFDKPLAVMVPDFNWLEKYTDLNKEQIDFLKSYDKPFTILCDSLHLKTWINFVNEETSEEFQNRDMYEKIAFRVAHNKIQEKLLKETWPIFLTSANLSNKPEIYSSKEIKESFWEYIERWVIKFVWENTGNLEKRSPSEIFEFDWETTDQIFLRK